jgi:hypothetical protein
MAQGHISLSITHIIGEENKRKDYNNITYIHKNIERVFITKLGVWVHSLLLHNWEAKHPPTNKFNDLSPALAPPSFGTTFEQQNSVVSSPTTTWVRKPWVRSVLSQVLPNKGERLLKDMLAFGNQCKTDQELKTLFAEKLTNSGSLKIHFYYQVKSLPASRVLSILVQAISLC